jgi:hypothetical protein
MQSILESIGAFIRRLFTGSGEQGGAPGASPFNMSSMFSQGVSGRQGRPNPFQHGTNGQTPVDLPSLFNSFLGQQGPNPAPNPSHSFGQHGLPMLLNGFGRTH